jgi:hypothetical protein
MTGVPELQWPVASHGRPNPEAQSITTVTHFPGIEIVR